MGLASDWDISNAGGDFPVGLTERWERAGLEPADRPKPFSLRSDPDRRIAVRLEMGSGSVGGGVYVGAYWISGSSPGRGFYLCSDFSDHTLFAPAYYRIGACPWSFLPSGGSGAKAIGIRGESEAPFVPGDPCVSTDTTLCLVNGRFSVTVHWTNFQGGQGPGHAANPTERSGTFWFFQEDIVEFLVKSVDGCSFNERFWFYAAATTSVAYEVVVTDTYARRSKTYRNELGVASPAITDSDAFATCNL